MTDFDKTETVKNFYNELINRFFNSKSYFFICVNKFLENSSFISAEADSSISQILSQLIQYLLNSQQPTQELKEITKIKGFEKLYLDLESQLEQYNLRHLDQPKLKKSIQNLALYLLKNIYNILLINENSRNTLTKYLDIKTKLRDLLEGSNGRHSNKELGGSPQKQINESPIENFFRLPDTSTTSADNISLEVHKENINLDNINLLESYFEKEITRLLKPLAIFSNKTPELHHNPDFIKQIHENFSQIQELAGCHGYEAVEAVAERVVQLMLTVLLLKHSIDSKITRLLYDAKSIIEKYIFHHQSVDNLKNFLDDYDHYILSLKNQISVKNYQTSEQNSATHIDNKETISFEINTSINDDEISPDDHTKWKDPIITALQISQPGHHVEDDMNQLNVPGEDDEELLKLIHDASMSNSSSSIEDFSETEEVMNTEPTVKDNIQANQVEEDEASINTIFQGEAALYYKILLNAVSQLRSEKKVQSALEDIELASSSLRQLAQKFGLEKIALLPDLMESISILAIKHIIRLPSSILQNIEDGVLLLKGFNQHDPDYQTQFMSILASLKEYYSKMFNNTKQIPISS